MECIINDFIRSIAAPACNIALIETQNWQFFGQDRSSKLFTSIKTETDL